MLVFDEADQMLMTEGFKDISFKMLSFIRKVSPDVQILLFSATFSDRIREYCNKVRRWPVGCIDAPSNCCAGSCAGLSRTSKFRSCSLCCAAVRLRASCCCQFQAGCTVAASRAVIAF